jgi:hypothetical protein
MTTNDDRPINEKYKNGGDHYFDPPSSPMCGRSLSEQCRDAASEQVEGVLATVAQNIRMRLLLQRAADALEGNKDD